MNTMTLGASGRGDDGGNVESGTDVGMMAGSGPTDVATPEEGPAWPVRFASLVVQATVSKLIERPMTNGQTRG